MDSTKQSLGFVTIMMIGFAIFSMHFGASCMLWPTTWGRDSGSEFLLCFAGFFLSGLILPALAYLAVSKGGGPLYTLSYQVGPKFVATFGTICVLLTGPLFTIPRMSAASWDAISRVTGLDMAEGAFAMSVVFQIAYYAIVYWFIYKESMIVDKLSKILVPALIIIEIAVIGKAIIDPVGPVAPRNYPQSAMAYGFVNGYQTMDLTCALMFAGIIVHDLKNRLGEHSPRVNYYLVLTGFLGFAIMGSVQLGEMYRGSVSSVLFPDLNYAKLSATVVLEQYGNVGGIIFNICLAFAAMTTAIGLAAGCGVYFENATRGKWRYKRASIATLILSCFISIIGLGTIVVWATPGLYLVYPPAIALVLCLCFLTEFTGGTRGACWGAFVWGIFEAGEGYVKLFGKTTGNPDISNPFAWIHDVPLMEYGLGFLWLTIAGFIIGHIIWKKAPVAVVPQIEYADND